MIESVIYHPKFTKLSVSEKKNLEQSWNTVTLPNGFHAFLARNTPVPIAEPDI